MEFWNTKNLSLLILLASFQAKADLTSAWQAWTNTYGVNTPLVAFVGDSITGGHTNYITPAESGGGPSGSTNGDVASWIMRYEGFGFRATNFGVSGLQAAGAETYLNNEAIIVRPKYVVMQIGINDLSGGSTWANVLSSWNNYLSKCVASNAILIASEVWPSGLATATSITNYNVSMRQWIGTNTGGARLIKAHDWMGDTANMGNILAAWTFDTTHPTTNGTARWAEIVVGKIRELESETTTYHAEDVSEIGVQAAWEAATNRDTVSIPAGAANWTTSWSMGSKGATLIGSGIGSTFITNSVTGNWMATLTLTANETNRISGIDFYGPNSDASYHLFYVQGASTDARRFRYDSNRFNYLNCGALKLDTVLGVMDHNILIGNAPGNKLAHVKDSTWGGHSHGNGAWTNASPLFGTENFFFFEDNQIYSSNLVFIMSAIDAQAGGRYVFRYNYMTNSYIEGHGSESSYERSTHAVEVYNNVFEQSNINSIVTFYRGGSGLVHDNTINRVTSASCLKLEDNRMNDSIFAPFGGVDGRNHWDVNDAGSPFVTGTCSSAGTLTMTDSGKAWTVNQYVGYTLHRTSGKAVTSVTRSGTTVTVSCTGHGFNNNDYVSLIGANQQEYNRTAQITFVDVNTFTMTTVGDLPTTPATGTIKACQGNCYAEINANTATQLTFNDSVFGSAVRMNFTAADTYEINKITHAMDQVGRTGGSLIDDTATPAFPAGWNDQTTSAWYQWNNTGGQQATILFGPTSATIVNGVHFNDNTAKPGYVPFVYPHPMVGPAAPVTVISSRTGPGRPRKR